MKTFDPIPNTPLPEASIDWPFTSHTGVGVSSIGEDGEDWIVQGHMDLSVAFELLRQCCADLYDESTAEDHFGPDGGYGLDSVKAGYGVFTEHAGWCALVLGEYDEDDYPDGPRCTCEGYGWYVSWGKVTADTPGAVALMVVEA